MIKVVILLSLAFIYVQAIPRAREFKRNIKADTDCFGVLSSSKYVCSGHGSCTSSNTCSCSTNWSGTHCEIPKGAPSQFPVAKAQAIAAAAAYSISSQEDYTFSTAVFRDCDQDTMNSTCKQLCESITPYFGQHFESAYGANYKSQKLACRAAIGFELLDYNGYSEPIPEQPTFYTVYRSCDAPCSYIDSLEFCICVSSSMTYTPHPQTYPPYYVPPNCQSVCPTPTYSPTYAPSSSPTYAPSSSPTYAPSSSPTYAPTTSPTYSPTSSPGASPTTSPYYPPP